MNQKRIFIFVAQIETFKTLDPYFNDLLKEALSQERLKLDGLSEVYLLKLISEFGQTNILTELSRPNEAGTPTLAWLLASAQQAGWNQFNAYRQLGDVALVVGGFFKPPNLAYHIDMGSTAYLQASTMAHHSVFKPLLAELAIRFRRLVDVFMRVSTLLR